MSALDKTPVNLNYLSPLGFKFTVKKLPHVNYFIQATNLPGVSINPTYHPTPFTKISIPGEHINYEPLSITFKVDEDMKNYIELYNWIRGLGFPDDFSEYEDLHDANQAVGDGMFSDISLILLTNLKNPNIEITYRDAHPISLSSVQFQTTDDDVIYLSCTVTFEYTLFDITTIVH